MKRSSFIRTAKYVLIAVVGYAMISSHYYIIRGEMARGGWRATFQIVDIIVLILLLALIGLDNPLARIILRGSRILRDSYRKMSRRISKRPGKAPGDNERP